MNLHVERMHMNNILCFSQMIDLLKLLHLYAPDDSSISMAALQEQLSDAKQSEKKYNEDRNLMFDTVTKRENAFDMFMVLASQALDYLKNQEFQRVIIEEGKYLLNTMHPPNPKERLELWENHDNKNIFSSIPKPLVLYSMGVESRIENMIEFVSFLQGVESYKPSTANLQVASLQNNLKDLEDIYTLSLVSFNNFSRSLDHLEKILYGKGDNLETTMERAIEYVLINFGKKDHVYKELKRLKYKKPNIN